MCESCSVQSSERLSKACLVRLTPEQKAEIEAKCDALGVTVADAFRKGISLWLQLELSLEGVDV